MRDILVTLLVFGFLPFVFKRPYLGIIMWVWISVMSPHTLAFGFAQSLPFAAIIAAVTIVSVMASKTRHKLPLTSFTWALLAFVVWMSFTTLTALSVEDSFAVWQRVMKGMLMIFVCLMLIKTREQIQHFVWILALSLGFYGIKGGIFTVRYAGEQMVQGPAGTFIGGNNEIALALIVIIPMMRFLQSTTDNKWIRRGLMAAMLLSALAALGTYSRGALLALAAMLVVLWLKSHQKILVGLILIVVAPIALLLMPAKWTERMDTIQTYQTDGSALGRFNAWGMTTNLAMDRPLTGGGFAIYNVPTYARYGPNPLPVLVAHSIYFQTLGEHGFPGLLLFLSLLLITWQNGRWIIRQASKDTTLKWASDLASMIQVSLVGFAVGGAFLSLAYLDVLYFLMVAMVAVRQLIAEKVTAPSTRLGRPKDAIAVNQSMAIQADSSPLRAGPPDRNPNR